MRLLVTGTGRTGTIWLTEALKMAGLDAKHEITYSTTRHGEGQWQVELSWLAAPYTPVKNAYVVHLVRHPLETIRSRAAWGSFEKERTKSGLYDPRIKGRWAMKHLPEIENGKTPIERAAIHWVGWNLMVKQPDEILRLEDVDLKTINRLVQIVHKDAPKLTELPTPNNQAPKTKPIHWSDVKHIPGLVNLANKYGYF